MFAHRNLAEIPDRQEDAQREDEHHGTQQDDEDRLDLLRQGLEFVLDLAAASTEAEREACAQLVEKMGIDGYGTLAIAAAIRARGNPVHNPNQLEFNFDD